MKDNKFRKRKEELEELVRKSRNKADLMHRENLKKRIQLIMRFDKIRKSSLLPLKEQFKLQNSINDMQKDLQKVNESLNHYKTKYSKLCNIQNQILKKQSLISKNKEVQENLDNNAIEEETLKDITMLQEDTHYLQQQNQNLLNQQETYNKILQKQIPDNTSEEAEIQKLEKEINELEKQLNELNSSKSSFQSISSSSNELINTRPIHNSDMSEEEDINEENKLVKSSQEKINTDNKESDEEKKNQDQSSEINSAECNLSEGSIDFESFSDIKTNSLLEQTTALFGCDSIINEFQNDWSERQKDDIASYNEKMEHIRKLNRDLQQNDQLKFLIDKQEEENMQMKLSMDQIYDKKLEVTRKNGEIINGINELQDEAALLQNMKEQLQQELDEIEPLRKIILSPNHNSPKDRLHVIDDFDGLNIVQKDNNHSSLSMITTSTKTVNLELIDTQHINDNS